MGRTILTPLGWILILPTTQYPFSSVPLPVPWSGNYPSSMLSAWLAHTQKNDPYHSIWLKPWQTLPACQKVCSHCHQLGPSQGYQGLGSMAFWVYLWALSPKILPGAISWRKWEVQVTGSVFLILYYLFCAHEYLPTCMSAHHVCAWYLQWPQDGVWFPGTGLNDGCELLCVCYDQTQVLFKSN